jgi:diguanylate cyclase (GGDEF)-like protein/PAS domain S-box-containing protein
MEPSAHDAIRILLVEDVPEEAQLLLRECTRGGLQVESCRVDSLMGLRTELARFRPDVILSDNTMPGFGGDAALALARERAPETPFIFVSGTIGEEKAVEALQHGAADYIVKSNLLRLVPAIRRALAEAAERRARVQAENARRLLEQRLLSIAEATREWLWERDSQHTYTFCSAAVQTILGYPPVAVVGRSVFDFLAAEDHARAREAFGQPRRRHGEWQNEVLRWRHQDGSLRWLESSAAVILDSNGHVTGYRGADRDVTERIQQQDRIALLTRMHAVLSGINAAISRSTERNLFFRDVCRIAIECGQFGMAWLGLCDTEQSTLHAVAWHGLGRDNLPEADTALSCIADAALADAMRQGQLRIVHRVDQAGSHLPLMRQALAMGCSSVALLPLMRNGRAAGVLALYADETALRADEELKLLRDLNADISYGIEHLAQAEQLAFASSYDSLTGLANRPLFFDRLAQTIAKRSPDLARLGVIVLDLQRFRFINSTVGRAGGDQLLKTVAARMQKIFPGSMLARISGDRFAAATTDLDLAFVLESWVIANLVKPVRIDGVELHPTIKLGIALYPLDGDNAETLFKNAEAALQRAKDTSDPYVFYSPEMNAQVARRVHLEARLRRAVAKQALVPYYQPKVDLRTRQIVGLEALLRWNDPELGPLAPADFIPLLEETGLILEVGWSLFEQVARDINVWRRHTPNTVRVAVNVSSVQLRQKDFVPTAFTVLHEAGGQASRIDLEITESLTMQDTESVVAKLQELRAAGMRVTMDDFGTGYSSLSQIARLPLDAVKIDRSFVGQLTEKPEAKMIVSTIVGLAKTLNIVAIAEGVELDEQYDVLRRQGCQQAQGYLFSRPVPAADMQAILMRGTAL